MSRVRPTDAHDQTALQARLKGTIGAKVALAAWRMRRTPAAARRSAALRREDLAAGRIPPEDPRTDFRAVYVIPAGPGERGALEELLQAIRHFEGDDVKVVVVDDATEDCREAEVRADWPEVSVRRTRQPAGSGLWIVPGLTRAYVWALERFSFDVLVKMDTDALVTGPRLSERAAEAFAADPSIGALGTCGVRADGVPEDTSYDHWVLAHERRWDRGIRRVHDAALAGGWDGTKVHGGVYVLSRAALERARDAGTMPWTTPRWSLLSEDTAISLALWGSGSRTASWGGPGEPTASGQGFLPIPKEQVLAEGRLAIHSVRRGIDGEDEAQLRAFFRAARAGA